MKFYVYAFLISLTLVSSSLYAQTTTNCTGAATWDANTAYNGGTQVKYNNVLYTANWWTQGNQPDVSSGATGSGQPWLLVGTCSTTNKGTRTASVSSASTGVVGNTISLTYNAVPATTTGTWAVTNGTGTATLSGSTLTLSTVGTVTVTLTIAEDASYYAVTSSQTITITAAATPPLDCSYIGIWDAALVYDGGDQAKINGILYQAKWWTQGNNPSTDNGPGGDKHWTLVGTCTTGGTTTNVPWMINGNHNATNASFIGTTNSQYLSFKSNSIEGMRLHPFGTLQLGGFTTNAITDGYFRADITGRVAMRPDPGVNQNNVLLLYSNNQATSRYTAGFKHYTGFSHVLLGTTEVGVMNVVEYNSTSGVTVGKHLLLQNSTEGNLGVGVFTTAPEAKLHVKGISLYEGLMTVKGNIGLGSDAARFMHPSANTKGEFQYIYFANRSFTDGSRFGAIGSYEETPTGVTPYTGQPRPLIIQGQDIAGTTYKPYVGIGYHPLPPTEQLSVNGNTVLSGNLNLTGNARFKGKLAVSEVFVTHNPLTDNFPDYVFYKTYKLRSLKDLELFINEHKHLPEIPSATEVKNEGGISLGEMNNLMLKKIEELTLYIIEQNKRIEALEQQISK
jgi:chitodextrinase